MSEIIDARARIQRLTEELEAAKAEIERLKGGKAEKKAEPEKVGFKPMAEPDEDEDEPKKAKFPVKAKTVKRQKVQDKPKKKGRR